jgi:hypothetical protein
MLMHMMAEQARSGSMQRLGVGKAMPEQVLWRVEWPSPLSTAMMIQIQTPERG